MNILSRAVGRLHEDVCSVGGGGGPACIVMKDAGKPGCQIYTPTPWQHDMLPKW